jgi:hypothetical protein
MNSKGSLADIEPGSIFHAECTNGARAICLVTSVDARAVRAKVITTQLALEFETKTGVGNSADGDYLCHVVSTEKLPDEINEVLLKIDYKYHFLSSPEGVGLLEDEVQALIFVDKAIYGHK